MDESQNERVRRMFGELFADLMEVTTSALGEAAQVAVDATTEVAETTYDMGTSFIGQIFD
jgi:hypothetical protein